MSFMSRSNKRDVKPEQEYPVFRQEAPPQKSYKPQTVVESSSGSFVGRTMKIEGDLYSDEDLTVEGHVKGTIKVSKTLTIGRDGNVSADIEAKVVRIIGTAKGTINATDKVLIMSEGRYSGNIRSEKLVVAEGAILIGDINKEEELERPETKEIPVPEFRTKAYPPTGGKDDAAGTSEKKETPEKNDPAEKRDEKPEKQEKIEKIEKKAGK